MLRLKKKNQVLKTSTTKGKVTLLQVLSAVMVSCWTCFAKRKGNLKCVKPLERAGVTSVSFQI